MEEKTEIRDEENGTLQTLYSTLKNTNKVNIETSRKFEKINETKHFVFQKVTINRFRKSCITHGQSGRKNSVKMSQVKLNFNIKTLSTLIVLCII